MNCANARTITAMTSHGTAPMPANCNNAKTIAMIANTCRLVGRAPLRRAILPSLLILHSIAQREQHLSRADHVAVNRGGAGAAPDPAAHLVERDLEPQRVTGPNRALEARVVDPCEQTDLALVFGQTQGRDRGRLR